MQEQYRGLGRRELAAALVDGDLQAVAQADGADGANSCIHESYIHS
jgi:hypothetical protein